MNRFASVLVAGLCLAVSVLCPAQAVFVNAQLTDGSGSVANAAFLHFELDNCGNNFPTIASPGASQNPWTIVRTAFDLKPNQPDGSIEGQVLGNDVILCGGVASTYYKVTAMKDATTALSPVGGQPYVICTALASGMMPCSNPGTGLWNPALQQPAFQPIQPGFVQIFGNPVVSQVWNQPAGTTANFYGSFFLNGVPLGTGSGTGSVTSFSSTGLTPLFTTNVATSTSTPALSFALTAAPANSLFGNPSSLIGPPAYTSTPSLTSLALAGGSASAPGLFFTGHTNSGLYYNSNAGPVISSGGFDVFGANVSGASPGPIGVPFGGGVSWYPTSGNVFTGGGQDTGISRLSPSILSVDSGVPGNSLGGLHLFALVASTIGGSTATFANLTITGGCTGCPGGALSTLQPAAAANTINNTVFAQAWQWAPGATTNTVFMSMQEAVAGSGSGNYLFDVHTLSTSATKPIRITAGGTSNGVEISTAGALSAIGSGSIAATTAGAATNLSGGAASSIPFQSGAGATIFLPYGADGQCVVGTAGAPAWGSCAGGGAITGASLVNHQIAWATSSSAITSTANFTFDGTHTMQLPAGGVFGTPDTGTPKFTFSSNLITSNVQVAGTIFNPSTGFEIGGAAPSGHYLRGNGTNYIDGTIQTGDIPSLAATYCTIVGCTMTGAELFSPDGTIDIGAVAATRPRDGNFTRHVVSSDYTATGSATPDTFTEQSAPGSSPSSGFEYQWADSTDHRLHDKNPSGIVGTTVVGATAATSNWANGISPAGVISFSQPIVTDVTGAAPIASPVFTTTATSPQFGMNARGSVSTQASAAQGSLFWTTDQNYGAAITLATNITWPVTQAVINTGSGTIVFTLSTPTNGISWFPTDCFQIPSGMPATDGLSSLNGVDLAVTSRSSSTPTSTVTITVAGTANSCQTGTVGSGLTSGTVTGLTVIASHYDMVLNGNTTIFNRLSSSSGGCPNYGSIRLCSGGTTSADQITAFDPTTTDMFTLIRRNPIATTGSNWAQVGDSTHATFTPGGLQTPALTISGGTPATACGSATGCLAQAEAATAGTPTSAQDYFRADSALHRELLSNNGGSELPVAQIIGSGTAALGTSSISSGACATVVTVSATGVASTDTITWTPNASIKAVTGYTPATTGGLSIAAYPTSNNANFDVCNWSSGSITPGAVTLNWKVVR